MAGATINFLKPPGIISEASFKEYSLVTDLNKKVLITQGRIFYNIDTSGKTKVYNGYFTYLPCFFKGKYEIEYEPFIKYQNKKTYSLYVPEDWDREEWKRMYTEVIRHGILNKKLHIKQTDPILKVYKL